MGKILRIKRLKKQFGFSVIELIIVLLVIAIIAVIALPQIIAANRLWRFAAVKREMVTLLREARQEAVSQRTNITFQYDDAQKRFVVFGGSFGAPGDSRNRIYYILGDSSGNEFIYGSVLNGSPPALGDSTNLTVLTNQKVEVNFQADGSVTDKNKNLKNCGLYFFNSKNQFQTAFAVSILGAGGRVKVWQFNQTSQIYVE